MAKVARRVLAVLGVLLLLTTVYGVAVEPRFVLDERRYAVALPALPQGWEGAEVAVFSDIQVGMWWANLGMVERVVARTVEEDPDVVLIAGDFLYGTSPGVAEQARTVVELLRPLTDAAIPTYAVLGNHDHHAGGADEVTAALEQAGVPVISNEAVVLQSPGGGDEAGEPMRLVGLAATRPGLTDVDAALADVPQDAARLVLMHNPAAFPRLPAGTAPLAVAGHTHCGQIGLPGMPRGAYLALAEQEDVATDGWAPAGYGEEGNALFVTCGIGFSIVPVRINAAPQLVLLELQPDEDASTTGP